MEKISSNLLDWDCYHMLRLNVLVEAYAAALWLYKYKEVQRSGCLLDFYREISKVCVVRYLGEIRRWPYKRIPMLQLCGKLKNSYAKAMKSEIMFWLVHVMETCAQRRSVPSTGLNFASNENVVCERIVLEGDIKQYKINKSGDCLIVWALRSTESISAIGYHQLIKYWEQFWSSLVALMRFLLEQDDQNNTLLRANRVFTIDTLTSEYTNIKFRKKIEHKSKFLYLKFLCYICKSENILTLNLLVKPHLINKLKRQYLFKILGQSPWGMAMCLVWQSVLLGNGWKWSLFC